MSYHHTEYQTATLYVLHSRAYRDTSAIITALSQEMGKITFVAKGIRSKKNAKIALLQPFIPLSTQVYGKNELKNLAKVEALGIGYNLGDIYLYSGMYLNELLVRLLPAELPFPEIYIRYQEAITQLSTQQRVEPVLREFEIQVLNDVGYGIDFQSEQQSGHSINESFHYRFDPELGLINVKVHNTTGNRRDAISGKTLLDISEFKWNDASLKAAKYINRMALQALLGDKPLKSRELFNKYSS